MAKKTSNRLPAITAPHLSKKRPVESKHSLTASVYYFLGDKSYRVFWTDNKGITYLQVLDKSRAGFPQSQSEMNRLLNFGRIIPISEIPIAEWTSNAEVKSPKNTNFFLKGTIYEQ